jgi:sarcosine oxidase
MFDTIVLGLGAMGSAAAYHLAQRGNRVLGIEQFTPAHEKGSSHGSSRIIRQAYHEHPDYVPLVLRAYELWERLEHDSGSRLLNITGGLMIGAPTAPVIRGSTESARQHGLQHEILDAAEIHRRFPPLTPQPDEIALHEPKAGYLVPEESIRQHLKEAARLGAGLHFEEPIESWKADPRSRRVVVKTSKASYEAAQLVISGGPWAPELLSALGLPLVVTRQVMFWLDPIGGGQAFRSDRFPIYIWQPIAPRGFYGFPSLAGERGVKVAIHGSNNICSPSTIDRVVTDHDLQPLRDLLASRIPSLNGGVVTSKTCMYTTTPDENFVLGSHSDFSNVHIAAGFSGHGFKFAPVIGEILADLAMKGATQHKIEMFSIDRFRKAESHKAD